LAFFFFPIFSSCVFEVQFLVEINLNHELDPTTNGDGDSEPD
jgi:hypothetical protein